MLLIAAIMVGIFCLTPFANIADNNAEVVALYAADAPVLLIVNILIAVLLLISIFMYNDLRRQMKMTILSTVLICASIVASFFYIYAGFDGASPVLLGGVILLVFAAVFALLALRGMRHDHKLLRSADRLR